MLSAPASCAFGVKWPGHGPQTVPLCCKDTISLLIVIDFKCEWIPVNVQLGAAVHRRAAQVEILTIGHLASDREVCEFRSARAASEDLHHYTGSLHRDKDSASDSSNFTLARCYRSASGPRAVFSSVAAVKLDTKVLH
ncbi:hypothetical protein NM688_g5224 [Phlebia brevispora]|uniref:Uncharacterized protein n=1 Tax=Phlebia brevispora TaxID=194682 RepID=A0ACC1SYF5_9APHY|nr:hypothetical protein NM688_g5224 [Phlebia brevispora]